MYLHFQAITYTLAKREVSSGVLRFIGKEIRFQI